MPDQIAAANFQTGTELGNRAPIGPSPIFFNIRPLIAMEESVSPTETHDFHRRPPGPTGWSAFRLLSSRVSSRSPMIALELNKQQRTQAISSLQRYFEENLDPIGDLP